MGVQTYHYSNNRECSWYDFTNEIKKLAKISCKINHISSSQYPTPAPILYYSVMEKNKLKFDYQTSIPYWKASLRACIELLLGVNYKNINNMVDS